MKTTLTLIVLLALLAPAPAGAGGGKQEVLDKIDSLLDAGQLEEAKRMIDYFLEKNPGDPDLVVLRDRWRITKGDLGGLLGKPEDRETLREVCWRIVAATRKANPDEWEALLHAGDEERAKELLEASRENGSPEDRRVAGELLQKLEWPAPAASRDVPEERVVLALRSGAPKQVARGLEQAVARGYRSPGIAESIRRLRIAPETPSDVRYGAADALLSLDLAKDEKALRAELRADLFSGEVRRGVGAGSVLVRHPGGGEKALQALIGTIETDDRVGRARPTLLELALAELARREEPGAREFLEERLDAPGIRVAAARALGVLGDEESVPALVDFVTSPPPAEEEGTSGGLGFLGGEVAGTREIATAEALRPALVGALAILRLTAGE